MATLSYYDMQLLGLFAAEVKLRSFRSFKAQELANVVW